MIRKEHRDNQIIIQPQVNPEERNLHIKERTANYFNKILNIGNSLGIFEDEIAKFQVKELYKNLFLPSENIQNAIENKQMITIEMYIFNVLGRTLVSGETIKLGRKLANQWREETGEEPLTEDKHVNGGIKPVKVYPREFLEKHIK